MFIGSIDGGAVTKFDLLSNDLFCLSIGLNGDEAEPITALGEESFEINDADGGSCVHGGSFPLLL